MTSIKHSKYIDAMGEGFDKLPALPKSWREMLVKIIPILALVCGILGILNALDNLRLILASPPITDGGGISVSMYISEIIASIIYLAAAVLLMMSYQPTKAKHYRGWHLLFWWAILALIGGLVAYVLLINLLLEAIIIFYLLFQIRPYYK